MCVHESVCTCMELCVCKLNGHSTILMYKNSSFIWFNIKYLLPCVYVLYYILDIFIFSDCKI